MGLLSYLTLSMQPVIGYQSITCCKSFDFQNVVVFKLTFPHVYMPLLTGQQTDYYSVITGVGLIWLLHGNCQPHLLTLNFLTPCKS